MNAEEIFEEFWKLFKSSFEGSNVEPLKCKCCVKRVFMTSVGERLNEAANGDLGK